MSTKPEAAITARAPHADVVVKWLCSERDGGSVERHQRITSLRNVPVALLYHGVPHVVMLASPADLEDLGVGFTLSEGIVARPQRDSRGRADQQGGFAGCSICGSRAERFSALLRRQRNLTGRTGCGLCGVETVEDAIRNPQPVRSDGAYRRAMSCTPSSRGCKRNSH